MPQSQQSQVYPPIYLLIYALIPAINGFVVLCPFMTCLSDTCLCALLFFSSDSDHLGCPAFSLGHLAFPLCVSPGILIFVLSCFYRLCLVVLPYLCRFSPHDMYCTITLTPIMRLITIPQCVSGASRVDCRVHFLLRATLLRVSGTSCSSTFNRQRVNVHWQAFKLRFGSSTYSRFLSWLFRY